VQDSHPGATVTSREFLRSTFKGNNPLGCAELIVAGVFLAAIGDIGFFILLLWIKGYGPGDPGALQ
jgi:hypothetical protein